MATWFQVWAEKDLIKPIEVIRETDKMVVIKDGIREKMIPKNHIAGDWTIIENEYDAIQYMLEYWQERIKRNKVLIDYLTADSGSCIDVVSFWKERQKDVQLSYREMFEDLKKEMR